MKIKLVRTGGFIPITKVAEADVNLNDQELAKLIEIIHANPPTPRIKDGTYYELMVGNDMRPIDLEKIPAEFKELFIKMKKDLRIIKR